MEVAFEHAKVEHEYRRWLSDFGTADEYDTKETVGLLDVLRAHFLIADYFYDQQSGLGGIGPRDPNLLHSAVYRQFVGFEGRRKWTDQYQRAATLVFGLVSDHPFHDANKRTGLLVMLYALHKMNRSPTVQQAALEDLMVEIADRSLDKYGRMKKLAKRSDDADVLFLADYLKRNSRERDSRHYTITYQELDRTLREFGHCLCNPHKNFIDVSRIETRRTLLGFGKKEERLVWLAQIGFPGWKSQVGKGAIGTVRKKTRLTSEYGVDSASFFRGADPLHALIESYQGPLHRLAFR